MDRPLVRGDLSAKSALNLFFIFFPLGLICSFFVNWTCFFIAIITAFLAILYDVYLKKIKLIGNFYIAYVISGFIARPDWNDVFTQTIKPKIDFKANYSKY